MADPECTRACQVCGSAFPATLNKSGKPRKTKLSLCSPKCRHQHSYWSDLKKNATQRAERKSARGTCSIDGCDKQVITSGMCAQHYYRVKKYGDPLHTKHGHRVRKQCAWCESEMILTPRLAAMREACSYACANHLKAEREGKNHRMKKFVCSSCHLEVSRSVRTENDAGRFCSRECAFALLSRMAGERDALRRIGEIRRRKARKAERDRYLKLVSPELQALRRIQARVKRVMTPRKCNHCGNEFLLTRKRQKHCSLRCKRKSAEESRKRFKESDAYRAARRAYKAKRRAIERGVTADDIDPIKVFERDKWRCVHCGVKTPKGLRGSYEDRAPELEHIISLADGGTHTWGNVACSCRKCNIEKGAESRGQLGLAIM